MISGLVERWLDALWFFGLMLLVLLVRRDVIPIPLKSWWSWLMTRVPLVLRFVVGTFVVAVAAERLLATQYSRSSQDLRPVLLATAVGTVVFSLLIPSSSTRKSAKLSQAHG